MAIHGNDVQKEVLKKRKRVNNSETRGKDYSRPRKSAKRTNASESEETDPEATLNPPKLSDKPRDKSILSPSDLGSEKSTRFIVFVGNIPYGCTTDAIEKHFMKVKPAKVRHITDKEKGTSKGYAFLEFDGYDRMKTCLNSYHGTKVKGRKIRVELTAGGGGAKSQTRREKIAAKNLRLNGQRFRREQEELGGGAKNSSKKGDSRKSSPKVKDIPSKVKYDSKAAKETVKRAMRKETAREREPAQIANANVHPSRKNLLDLREHG